MEAAKHFDVTAFTNMTDVELIRAAGYRSEFLQIGYDERVFNTDGAGERSGVVFLGNNYGGYKFAESDGRRAIEQFLASDLFEAGSARCIPVDRLNYQSYGGFKARRVSEYLFSARKSSIAAAERHSEALEWTGKALG